MHTPTTRAKDFIAQLQSHVGKQLVFERDGRRIQPGYHVTEIKAASFRSLDCGARTQHWEETIVQLWDVADRPEQGHMSVSRFMGIWRKVDRDVRLNGDTEIKFEWGDAVAPAIHYVLAGLRTEGGDVVVSLEPVRATCKPRDEWWLAQNGKAAAACCGSSASSGQTVVGVADVRLAEVPLVDVPLAEASNVAAPSASMCCN
jgi:hypothetical protein